MGVGKRMSGRMGWEGGENVEWKRTCGEVWQTVWAGGEVG